MCRRVCGIFIVLISSIQVIHSEFLRCYSGSINHYIEVSLNNATEIIDTPYLNITRPTIMYTFGYLGKTDGPATIKMMTAYTAIDNINVCLLDWETEANFGVMIFSYPLVVEASKIIGDNFGKAILDLSEAGMNLDTLHLIGLSLGAQLMGTTGRTVIAGGKTIARITGLDPAYPEYDGLIRPQTPLGKSDAKFVDIIHTDPGHKGMNTPTATIDFFANYGFYKNGTDRQPGCPLGVFIPFSTDDLCSHTRSVDLLIQSLNTPEDLVASRAESYEDWVLADGKPNYVTYIGDLINKEYSGVYYLSTNSEPPYGKGAAGLRP